MISLDYEWCKEFDLMMKERMADFPPMSLSDIPLPDTISNMPISTQGFCYIDTLQKEEYAGLSKTVGLLLDGETPKRRKLDPKTGDYAKDAMGNFIYVDVTIPNNSICIISKLDLQIDNIKKEQKAKGVYRYRYKQAEGEYMYVDCIEDGFGGTPDYYYIIPRNKVYKANSTALIISLNKRGAQSLHYSGMRVALTNGYYVYVYVIPFKPSKVMQKPYRIVNVKIGADYSYELQQLFDYWNNCGAVFPYEMCEADGTYKGISNMGYYEYPPTLDDYILYNNETSMQGEVEESEGWGFDVE